MTSRNVQNGVVHLFDAYNAKDIVKACAGYADDVRFITHSTGRVLEGLAAVRKHFEDGFRNRPDARAEITRITDGGDTVCYEFMISGTDGATGRRYSVPCVDVVSFDAQGRITAEDNYSDRLTRMEQLGTVPAAAA